MNQQVGKRFWGYIAQYKPAPIGDGFNAFVKFKDNNGNEIEFKSRYIFGNDRKQFEIRERRRISVIITQEGPELELFHNKNLFFESKVKRFLIVVFTSFLLLLIMIVILEFFN